MLMFGGTLTCATCIELVEFLEWHCHWGLGGSWKSLCLRFYTLPLQLPVARAEPSNCELLLLFLKSISSDFRPMLTSVTL